MKRLEDQHKSRSSGVKDQYAQRVKNAYKMVLVQIYRFVLDIFLFYLFWLMFRYGRLFGMNGYGFRYNYFVTIAYAGILYWFKKTYNANLFGYFRVRTLVLAQFLSQVFSAVIVYVVVSIGWQRVMNPTYLILLLGLQLCVDMLWSYYGSEYYFRIHPKKRTLLIYRNDIDRKRFGAVHGKPIERLYEIVDELEFDGSFHELETGWI